MDVIFDIYRIFPIIFIIIFILGIITGIRSRELLDYLKYRYNKRWEDLTTLFGMTGCRRPVKFIKYIYSHNENNDEHINELRNKIKKTLIPFLIIFFIYALFIIVSMIILLATQPLPR